MVRRQMRVLGASRRLLVIEGVVVGDGPSGVVWLLAEVLGVQEEIV